MSQNLSFESNSSLNPVLQAALSSLDVQLEEELARYRRQKSGRPTMSGKGLGRNQTRKAIDLIAVERVGTQPQRPALGMSTAPLASFPLIMVPPTDAAPSAPPQQTPLEQIKVAPPSPGMVVAAPNPSVDQSGTPPQTEPLTPPEPAKAGDLTTVVTPQTSPEDYLESSEHLLRSLAQEETTPPPKKSFAAKLLTPLGIGSILLLLLSGATAVFVLSNPSSFDRLFSPKKATPPQSSVEPASTAGTSAKDTPVVNGPDLASDEFVDLNLNNLSHLQTTPKAPPAASSVEVPALPTLQNGVTNIPPVAPSVVPNNALPKRAADLSSVLLSAPPQARSAPYTPIPRVAPLPTPMSAAPKSNTANKSKTQAALSKSNTANKSKTQTVASKSSPSNKSKTQVVASKSNTANKSKTQVVASKSNTAKSDKTQTVASKSNTANKSKTPEVSGAKPTLASSPVQVAAGIAGTSVGYYYVLLNEGGERVLEQARTIVADAFVEKFPEGTRIQMGAFPSESEAKAMVEELQRQGLTASIYHP